ncbi:MAG: transrane transport protein [Actinomycetota bacterium]|jgi:purine-cytosine permease-like protein
MPAIESFGVDTIPDSERSAKPKSLIPIFLGSNLSLSVMVFGWLAILYGLGFWQAVSAIVVGTVAGALFVSRTALLGWRASTNNSVASGAFFGVRGRLVASFVGLLLCIQYVALTVWTGGEVIAGVFARSSGVEPSNLVLAASYLVIAVLVVIFAIYGYSVVAKLNTWISVLMGGLVLLTVIAFWPNFDPSYAGVPELYALVDFWPTWLLAALTAGAAGPISYVTQTGDWSRYISASHSESEVVRSTFWALVIGLTIPTVFGAFVATVAFDEFSFVAGFVAGSPEWMVLPLVLVGIVGSLGQGSMNLYSMGLDMDAIVPKLSRIQATVAVASFATLLVFLGKFAYDAAAAVTNSVLFLTALATSWTAISLYGYLKIKGQFDQSDLQVFNTGRTGGRYWFTSGWNLKALVAWAVGSLVGIFGISSVDYVGPISNALQGVDVSIPLAAITGLALYVVLQRD